MFSFFHCHKMKRTFFSFFSFFPICHASVRLCTHVNH
jgi:hypothetical protein